jgi:hypothetical protein
VQRSANYDLVTLQPRLSYTASGAPDWERRFIVAGGGFSSVLLGSRALRWMVPGAVLGDVVASLSFTGLLSLPTSGSMWMGKPVPCTVLQSVAVR